MLSLFCLWNVHKTWEPDRRNKSQHAEEETCVKEWNLRELTPFLPPRLGELDSIAVTHGAEEDHCQHHQSQLHSPCCLLGHAGSPPAARWIRWGGGGGPSTLGQVDPTGVGTAGPSFLLSFRYCSLSLYFLPLFPLLTTADASLWSGGWCCGCESKRAWDKTSHHAGGSKCKGSRQSGMEGVELLCWWWRGGEEL